MNLADYDPGSLKVLLLGPSGSGKTTLACTLGPHATVLDINNGLASAKYLKDAHTSARLQIDVRCCWDVGSRERGDYGRPDLVWNETVKQIKEYMRKPWRDVLVIDGLTDLTNAALGAVLVRAGKWAEVISPSQPEWGAAIAQVQRLWYGLMMLKNPVVVVAHTKLVEVDGISKEVLACYGTSLPKDILKGVDEVWYMKVRGMGEKRTYTVQSMSTGGVECKTRRQLRDGMNANVGMVALMKSVGWTSKEHTCVSVNPQIESLVR